MKRNKIIVALSLIACTLLSCQKEKEQPSSLSNESKIVLHLSYYGYKDKYLPGIQATL